MKFLIIFIYLITTTSLGYAIEKPNIQNLVLTKKPKTYANVVFKDENQKDVNLGNYKGKLLVLNFWATWCAPCKEEMPSLDKLQSEKRLNNIKVFPINIGQENVSKSKKFFDELDIQNLDIYFDSTITLAKKFTLRGVPTTIFFNKEGNEFARIIGSIDFSDEEFINWLKFYN
jgi:thiol-disulfide isomerase/thioredoxin